MSPRLEPILFLNTIILIIELNKIWRISIYIFPT